MIWAATHATRSSVAAIIERVPRTFCTATFIIVTLLPILGVSIPASFAMTVASGPMQEFLFKEGKRHYDEANLEKAEAVWSNIFPGTFFGPVCYLLLARAQLEAGHPEKAEDLLMQFLKRHQNTVYRGEAKEMLVEALCRQGKPEAKALLSAMLKEASEKDRPAVLLRMAELERRRGNFADAAVHYRTLFLKYPASVQGLNAAEAIAWMVFHEKIPRMKFTEQEELARAKGLFAKGRFDLAAEAYAAVLKVRPGDKSLMLKLGQCYFKARRNQQAINVLKDVLKGEKSQRERVEAVQQLSLVYWRLDRGKDFEACSQVILREGTPAMKKKALFNLAAYNLEHHRFGQAWSHFERLIKENPDRPMKALAKWKMAWIKYLSRDFANAAAIFREVRPLAVSRELVAASKYWEARSLMLAKRTKEAQALFKEVAASSPFDYYGIEASRMLETSGVKPPSGKRNGGGAFPKVSLTSAERSDERVRDAEKLMELGLYDFALTSLMRLPGHLRSSPAVTLMTAKSAYGAKRYHLAQEILSRGFGPFMERPPENAPPEFVEMAFPRVHFSKTRRLAERHSVDPHLVWAVIRQESRYDATAVSPAGALGLMQVTPGAAGFSKKRGRVPAKAIEEILDPERNIEFGIRILAKNLRSFKGNVVPAVASYNADIAKVRQWVRKNGKLKQDEFIENIPYRETRTYVKRVLAGYKAYAQLHRKKDLAGLW